MSVATAFLVKRSVAVASPTSLPRTRSTTSRAFWADVPRYSTVADATSSCGSTLVLRLLSGLHDARRRRRPAGRPGGGGRRGRIGARVAPERAGRGELSQLVPDHVLRNVDRDEFLPVVHRD